MIIIVEGTDGVGKTTLTKEIAKTFNFKYYKEDITYQQRLSSDYNGFEHYFKLLQSLYLSNENIICDRLHLGEFVNPLIYKDGRDPLTVKEISEIEFHIRDNAILIGCFTDIEFIKNSLIVRGDDIAKVENIKYMTFLYDLVINDISTIKNKILWDLQKDRYYDKIFEKIKILLKKNN
jgi:Cdc6-like AAA superfamily ATPase